jgi:RsiW-degrading membrane proteinase PrsW (M82 family)
VSAQPTIFGEGVPPRWGYQTSFWQRRQPAFWLFVVTLALTGFVALGKQLEMIQVAPAAWFITLFLLLPYAIPVLLVIYLMDLYEREPLSILAAALLWGGIVATTLSLYTNTPLGELIFKLTANPTFTSEWSAALTAPFVEEGFKALGVILLISLARAEMDDVLDGFVWGATVGLGFLLVEDVFYFVRTYVATGGSYDGLLQVFLIRILGAGPYSHFLYTGLIGMGVAFYQTRTDEPWSRRVLFGVALAAAGVGAHFFWNSPLLGELLGDGGLVGWVMYVTAKGLPMLIGLLLLVRLARRREQKWFARLTAVQVDDGTITADELRQLNRIVTMWLDFAEDQAHRRKQVFLKDWESKLDEFLRFNERAVLGHRGRVSKDAAHTRAEAEYEEFATRRRAMLEAEGERDAQKALEDAARKLPERPQRKGPKR